jgi:hypothetical protein
MGMFIRTMNAFYIEIHYIYEDTCLIYAKSAGAKIGRPLPVLYTPNAAPLKKNPLSSIR